MSGVEVLGVVLGVLPLIISAVEHYNDIIDPIRTHRKYSSVLQTLITEINAQRDIFQNECILILSHFVDQHTLEDMLKDPKHDLRNQLKHDEDLQEKLSSMIGSHASQLQGILKLINDTLNDIYEETKNLPDGLERPQRVNDETIDMKAWRSHVRQKMKLSLRKDYLNQKINDLRNRNQKFLALCQQIVRFNASWTPVQTQSETQTTEKALGKVQKLRSTSQMLYHHLEKLSTCSNHAEHSANLRICLETTELYFDAPPKMSFEMAITYWDVEKPTIADQDPILLAIESMIETASVVAGKPKASVRFTDSQTDQAFQPTRIRRQQSADIEKRNKAKEAIGKPSHIQGLWRKLRRDEPRPPSGSPSPTTSPDQATSEAAIIAKENMATLPSRLSPSTPLEPTIQDLTSVNNLCTHLSGSATALAHSNSSTTTTNNNKDSQNCIGYLTGLGTDRYLIYKRPSPSNPPSPAISLSALILSHRRQQSLPKPEKWRLAGALSLAVLLYHSTPWFQTTLKSSDILFFHYSSSHRPSLKHPHLRSTPHHHQPRRRRSSMGKSALARDGYVKNPILYQLGLILLELEFEDTLESLVVESKLDGFADVDAPLTQQCLLLKRRAGTQLGTLYGRIVRMCLDCDFGLGLEEYRLDDVKVQRVFYERVVRKFQERMPEFERIWEDD